MIEVLIVISILGILMAMVLPNLTGFLGRGTGEAYQTERNTIQAAVSAYYLSRGPTHLKYPTDSGLGSDTPITTVYVRFAYLVAQNLLREIPSSASSDNLPGAKGSYSWFIAANGVVSSSPPYTSGIFP